MTTGGIGGGSGGTGGAGGTGGENSEDIGTFSGLTGFDHKLAMVRSVACGIGATGEITCQGEGADGWDTPPAGPWERISMGDDSACALDAEGNVACWGNVFSDLVPSEGPFTAIAVQGDAACGIRPSGRIRCWGEDYDDLLTAPEGTFTDLVMHDDEGCALASDGHIQCWGAAFHAHGRVDGVFTQLALQYGNLCTLDAAGKIACYDSFAERYEAQYSVGTYVTFSVANGPVCGVTADGSIDCFDSDAIGRLPPPLGPWVEVAGYYSAQQCARAMDGRVECWGQGFGDGAATLECAMGESNLSGTIGGAEFTIALDIAPQYSLGDIDSGYRFAYTTGSYDGMDIGLMVFDGDAMIGYDSVAERALEEQGEVAITRGTLMFGGDLTQPGELFCTGAGSGSTMGLHIDEVALDLQNLHELGSCADGAPVDGELTFCQGTPDCEWSISGTIEGMDTQGYISQGGLALDGGVSSVYGRNRDLLRVVSDEAGNVVWAVYIADPDAPFAGAAYCAGEGSTVEQGDNDGVTYTLRNLVKLDTCPAETSADTLTGCVR